MVCRRASRHTGSCACLALGLVGATTALLLLCATAAHGFRTEGETTSREQSIDVRTGGQSREEGNDWRRGLRQYRRGRVDGKTGTQATTETRQVADVDIEAALLHMERTASAEKWSRRDAAPKGEKASEAAAQLLNSLLEQELEYCPPAVPLLELLATRTTVTLPPFDTNFISMDGARSPPDVSQESSYPGRYPYTAYVADTNARGDLNIICAGVLVAPNAVLAAARCGGGHTVYIARAFEYTTDYEKLAVAGQVVHPKYNSYTDEHDLILYLLADKSSQPPIRMDDGEFGSALRSDDLLHVIAWAPSLSRAISWPVRYVDNEHCNVPYDNWVYHDMMCAADVMGGPCEGHKGGPIILQGNKPGSDILLGVSSWGFQCRSVGFPGVYSRLGTAAAWVQHTLAQWPGATLPVPCTQWDSQFANEVEAAAKTRKAHEKEAAKTIHKERAPAMGTTETRRPLPAEQTRTHESGGQVMEEDAGGGYSGREGRTSFYKAPQTAANPSSEDSELEEREVSFYGSSPRLSSSSPTTHSYLSSSFYAIDVRDSSTGSSGSSSNSGAADYLVRFAVTGPLIGMRRSLLPGGTSDSLIQDVAAAAMVDEEAVGITSMTESELGLTTTEIEVEFVGTPEANNDLLAFVTILTRSPSDVFVSFPNSGIEVSHVQVIQVAEKGGLSAESFIGLDVEFRFEGSAEETMSTTTPIATPTPTTPPQEEGTIRVNIVSTFQLQGSARRRDLLQQQQQTLTNQERTAFISDIAAAAQVPTSNVEILEVSRSSSAVTIRSRVTFPSSSSLADVLAFVTQLSTPNTVFVSFPSSSGVTVNAEVEIIRDGVDILSQVATDLTTLPPPTTEISLYGLDGDMYGLYGLQGADDTFRLNDFADDGQAVKLAPLYGLDMYGLYGVRETSRGKEGSLQSDDFTDDGQPIHLTPIYGLDMYGLYGLGDTRRPSGRREEDGSVRSDDFTDDGQLLHLAPMYGLELYGLYGLGESSRPVGRRGEDSRVRTDDFTDDGQLVHLTPVYGLELYGLYGLPESRVADLVEPRDRPSVDDFADDGQEIELPAVYGLDVLYGMYGLKTQGPVARTSVGAPGLDDFMDDGQIVKLGPVYGLELYGLYGAPPSQPFRPEVAPTGEVDVLYGLYGFPFDQLVPDPTQRPTPEPIGSSEFDSDLISSDVSSDLSSTSEVSSELSSEFSSDLSSEVSSAGFPPDSPHDYSYDYSSFDYDSERSSKRPVESDDGSDDDDSDSDSDDRKSKPDNDDSDDSDESDDSDDETGETSSDDDKREDIEEDDDSTDKDDDSTDKDDDSTDKDNDSTDKDDDSTDKERKRRRRKKEKESAEDSDSREIEREDKSERGGEEKSQREWSEEESEEESATESEQPQEEKSKRSPRSPVRSARDGSESEMATAPDFLLNETIPYLHSPIGAGNPSPTADSDSDAGGWQTYNNTGVQFPGRPPPTPPEPSLDNLTFGHSPTSTPNNSTPTFVGVPSNDSNSDGEPDSDAPRLDQRKSSPSGLVVAPEESKTEPTPPVAGVAIPGTIPGFIPSPDVSAPVDTPGAPSTQPAKPLIPKVGNFEDSPPPPTETGQNVSNRLRAPKPAAKPDADSEGSATSSDDMMDIILPVMFNATEREQVDPSSVPGQGSSHAPAGGVVPVEGSAPGVLPGFMAPTPGQDGEGSPSGVDYLPDSTAAGTSEGLWGKGAGSRKGLADWEVALLVAVLTGVPLLGVSTSRAVYGCASARVRNRQRRRTQPAVRV